MRFRKLRIAWSLFWGLACVLLIVLWVRSYRIWDRCYWPGKTTGVQLNSDAGHVVLCVGPHVPSSHIVSFFAESRPTFDESKTFYKDVVLGFFFSRTQSDWRLDVPYWFIVLLSMLLPVTPWLRQFNWRFSTRTLLIATTLVAVVLGLIVWTAS